MSFRPRAVAAVLVTLALAIGAVGCGVPRTLVAPAPRVKDVPSAEPVESGFLSDYQALRPSGTSGALKSYREGVLDGSYRKLLFHPVAIWRGSDRRLEDVSEEDLQYLGDALHRAVHKRLGASLELVTRPGPGVLEIQLALTLVTDPESSIDFFSTAVPVRHLDRREGTLVAGTRRFVRDCALEVELSVPGVRSARASYFDARRGSETSKSTVETWEDVHAALDKWTGLLE